LIAVDAASAVDIELFSNHTDSNIRTNRMVLLWLEVGKIFVMLVRPVVKKDICCLSWRYNRTVKVSGMKLT